MKWWKRNKFQNYNFKKGGKAKIQRTDNDELTLSDKCFSSCKNSSRTSWPWHEKGKGNQGNARRKNFQKCEKKNIYISIYEKKRKKIMTDTCLPMSLDLRGYTKLDVLYLFKRNFARETQTQGTNYYCHLHFFQKINKQIGNISRTGN